MATLLLAVAVVGAAVGCEAAPGPTAARTTPASAAEATATAPVRPAHQRTTELGVTFASGPFLVTVGEVVHDTRVGTAYLAIRFRNLSERWANVDTDGVLLLDGAEVPLFPLGAVPYVPPGLSTDVTYEAPVGEADPTSGVLRWGRPDQTHTTVRMADGTAEGFGPPVRLAVDGWGQIGRVTVHLTGGELFPDAVRGARVEGGGHVLRLSLDDYHSASSVVNGFYPAQHLLLRWPDGTTVEPIEASDGRSPLSWTAAAGHTVDFPVPADPTGDYEVLLASVATFAVSNFHPALVERVSIPLRIELPADHAPLVDPAGDGALPRALLPRAEGDPLPAAVDVALATDEVNLPGYAFSVGRLTWDPSSATATVEGTVRLIPPIVPPDDGILAVPAQFLPNAALQTGGRTYAGILASELPTVTLDTPATIAWQFPFVPELDPADATLFVGDDGMVPSVLPLATPPATVLDPGVPVEAPIEAAAVTAGNHVVRLVGYRFGFPRLLDRPPTGMRALEVIAEVTARQVEQPGPFGLLFAAKDRLFIRAADGYLLQAADGDLADLEDGQTMRIAASFYVPAGWEPGTMAFTVRTADEIRDINDDSWGEVTFGATLLPPADAQPASFGGSER